jgi:hypothetical protein
VADDEDPVKGAPEETDQAEDETDDPGPEDPGTEDDPTALKRDRDTAIRRRDRALAAKRKAEAELAELRKGKDDGEPDPVETANARLVRQSTRTALAAAGIAKEDHADVLDLLNLGAISVDSHGDPDEDAIEDAIATLQRLFGGTPNGRKPRPRVDTRDKGSAGGASDPDEARYRKFLGRR